MGNRALLVSSSRARSGTAVCTTVCADAARSGARKRCLLTLCPAQVRRFFAPPAGGNEPPRGGPEAPRGPQVVLFPCAPRYHAPSPAPAQGAGDRAARGHRGLLRSPGPAPPLGLGAPRGGPGPAAAHRADSGGSAWTTTCAP